MEAYGCLGVLQIDFEDKISSYLVLVTGCFSIGKIYDSEVFRITQTSFIPLQCATHSHEDRVTEVKKLLNSGTFYFSWSSTPQRMMDITLNVQQKYVSSCTDNRFFW